MNETEQDIKRERDYWRSVAAYLAECHAATAEYDGQLSGTSQSRKKRYAALCEKAALAMQRGFYPRASTDPQEAQRRCINAIQLLGFKVSPLLQTPPPKDSSRGNG